MPDPAPNPGEGYYKVYEEYAKTLRAWFVGYGVDGPLLISTNDKASGKLAAAPGAGSIAVLFALGVAAQILLSLINKYANWAIYFGEEMPDFKSGVTCRIAEWISEKAWIDAVCDIFTLVVFTIATLRIFNILQSG